MARAARAMAMATKRVMVTNGNTTDNGHGKKGGGSLMAAIMAMGMGTARGRWLLALLLERGGSWWQWAMVSVCVFV